MGQLIRLADYAQDRAPRAPLAEEDDLPHEYYCTRCHGESFKLLRSGTVQCGRCRARISNLRVTGPAQPRR
jgi:DNA-directed RNA polymerase subunit RPC12/RpoP